MTDPLMRQVALAMAALDLENELVAAKLREDPQFNPDAARLEAAVAIENAAELPDALGNAIAEWALNHEATARAWLCQSKE